MHMSLLRRPLGAAVIAFLLALPAFAVLKAHSATHYPVSREAAIRIARADKQVAPVLRHREFTTVRVSPIDRDQQRVSFFDGQRLVLHAAVSDARRVTHVAVRAPGVQQSGSLIANYHSVLIVMTLLFVLATATVPLLSLRNLDVLAFASFTVPVWLMNDGFVYLTVLAAYPPAVYLTVRCLAFGLRGGRPEPRRSLFWHVTSRLAAGPRQRIAGALVAGMAVMVALVTVTSTGPSDVAFAALAGATDLVHGVVPYGHIPDFILHGDTYPLLTYAVYIPAAAVMPVRDFFDDPQGALVIAAVAALLGAAMLYRLASRSARDAPDGSDEPARVTGLRTALAWLAFPPVLLTASSGSNDVILAVFILAALLATAHRTRSAVLIGVAAWVKVIPLLALPVWLARMNRLGVARTVAGLAALSAILTGWIVALGGFSAIATMVHALGFQFERGSLSSLWVGFGLEWLQPAAEAALVAAVVAATLAVRRDRELRDDLSRLAGLLAGLILLSQVVANYWTWAYLPWAAAPALLVLVRRRAAVAAAA